MAKTFFLFNKVSKHVAVAQRLCQRNANRNLTTKGLVYFLKKNWVMEFPTLGKIQVGDAFNMKKRI